MQALQVQRTAEGYQTKQAAITRQELSDRQTLFALLAIALALPYKQVAELMGITHASVQKLAQQLFWKLRVNNLQEASREIYKRGLIKHLCILLLAGITTAPPADAMTNRLPRNQRSGNQIRRSASSRRSQQHKLAYYIQGLPMTTLIMRNLSHA